MKKVILATVVAALGSYSSQAANYLTVDFSTGYVDGNLAGLTANAVGQNGWAQTSTASTTPIQYSSTLGAAVLGTSGQDIWKSLTTAAPATAGTTLLTRVDFKLTSAQATGDYFFHVSDPGGTTSNLYQRLFARSATGGFNLGLTTMSGTGSQTIWGTSVFNFNQIYTAVIAWDFVSGSLNDTMAVYVNPTSNIRSNLTSELSSAWLTSSAEPTTVSAINLRQGNASNAAAGNVYYISLGSTLGDVGVIPEPSSFVLMMLGAAGLIGIRSLSRKQI